MKRDKADGSDSEQPAQVKKKRKVEKVLEENEPEELICVRKLREQLRSGNFYDDLKRFLKIAPKSPDLVAEYIALGGKPLEVVEIISSHEDSGIETLSLLYHFLKLLVSQIVDEKNDTKTKVATDAVKCLIRKAKVSVNKMLLSSNLNDKVVTFELLSIGVSLDREIGIEIMKNVELFSKTEDKSLSSQLYGEEKVNPQDMKRVRSAFTTMMMEFMMRTEDDVILCKRVVMKRPLFEFFLEGIHRDSVDTIIDIIACLSKRVLLSAVFSKPEKLKVFTDEALKSLLKLYEWKNGDDEEKQKVIAVAHQFLILLLANRKYGIVFKALSEKRQNLRQLHVINLFKTVWMYEYPSLLTIEIIKSCPELMQHVLNRLAVGLQPRVTAHWFMCANFTKLLIEALEPEEMIKQFATLESKKISSNIVKLSISQFILQNLNENALLQGNSLEIREMSVQILRLMLERCCKFVTLVAQMTTLKDYEKHKIKFDIINHIFTFYPHIDMILNSLYRSINHFKKDNALAKSQMKNTLSILLLTAQHFPSVIEKIPSVIDFLDVLRPIYESDRDDSDIEINVAKVILYLQPNLLSLKPQLFHRVFFMLIQIVANDEDKTRKNEAKNILINILQHKFNFFNENPFDMIIWIESFRYLSVDAIKDAATLLVNALEKTENVSEVLQNLLQQKSNKFNKILDFIETTAVLLYHTFPERRKNILGCLKETELIIDGNILSYLKKKGDFKDIAEKESLELYQKLKEMIHKKVDLDSLQFADENQLLLANVHLVLFALKDENLNDKAVENLTKLAEKIYSEIKNFDKQNLSDEIEEIEDESEKVVVNKIFRLKNVKLTELSARYIFEVNSSLFDAFSLTDEGSRQITKFIANLAQIFKDFGEISHKFRDKVVSELEEQEEDDTEILSIVNKFPLDENQCSEIFNSCAKKKNFSLVNFLVQRLIEINEKSLDAKQMKQLEEIYLKADEVNCTMLEETILEYLRTFPHAIAHLSTKIFAKGCEEDALITRKSFIALLIKLFKSKRECDEIFLSKYKNMRKETVYPLLYVALEQNILPQAESRSLFQKEFKAGILKSIERPKRAAMMYRESLNTTLKLIESVMAPSECCDIALKKFKFDGSELYQLKMLETVFTKAINHKNEAEEFDDSKQIFSNFINHWLQLVCDAANENLEYFEILTSWLVKNSTLVQVEVDVESLKFAYKIGLKNGLKSLSHSNLLITLGLLLKSTEIEENAIDEMFDMLITHSNFFMTAFNTKSSGIRWKTSLFYLFEVLIQKNPKLASEKHIPILLSSYNASMSSCDRLILNLLKFYEFECNIDLYDYRPLTFGAAALSHYSISKKEEETSDKNKLDGKVSAFYKLANQFEKSIIENTINNYPINLRENFDAKLFLKNVQGDKENSKIYDPAYFLPIFEMLLTTDSFNFMGAGIKNNLLSLIMPALSCEDEKMRLMATRILLNCKEATDGKKKQKDVWKRFYEGLQKGLFEMKEKSSKKKEEIPRIAPVLTQMLAEFTKVLPNKLHVAHHQISNHLIIKDRLDLTKVPEYLTLLESHSVQQHEEQRLFLLNTIYHGIKDRMDLNILNNMPIVKMLLTSFGSPLSSRKIDLLILKIIDRIITNAHGAEMLLKKFGLALWVFLIATKVEPFEYDAIQMIVTLIHNILQTDAGAEGSLKLLTSLLTLLPKYSKNQLAPSVYALFLDAVIKTNKLQAISKGNFDLIMDIGKFYVTSEQFHSLSYIQIHREYCEEVEVKNSSEIDSSVKEIYESMKKIIMNSAK